MNLYCDNYALCNQLYMDRGSVGVTNLAASFKGWYLFRGYSYTGKRLDITLCPSCYGKMPPRFDPRAPLEGQLELFEEDEPVVDVQRAFDEGVKLQTRSPDEQGATAAPPEAGRDV